FRGTVVRNMRAKTAAPAQRRRPEGAIAGIRELATACPRSIRSRSYFEDSTMIDTWIQDVRFAVRLLRKSPLFTATAALSLAIGIGANATIFSVASAMLLRPMPGLTDSDRLVDVGRVGRGADFDTVSYPNYADIRDRVTTLRGVFAHQIQPTPMSLGRDGEAE